MEGKVLKQSQQKQSCLTQQQRDKMKEKRFTKEANLFNNKSQATNTLVYSSAKIMTTVEALLTTMN
jgi:hypothetical protein